jgi:hypothetical protein
LQALAAHLINLWDKTLLFRSAAAAAGAGPGHHLLSMLQVKGSCRLSLPVLRDNLNRVLRGTGGGAGAAGLGSVVHISSAEDAPDNDSELVSMVSGYFGWLFCAGGLGQFGTVRGALVRCWRCRLVRCFCRVCILPVDLASWLLCAGHWWRCWRCWLEQCISAVQKMHLTMTANW